jgi:hypothetical protein
VLCYKGGLSSDMLRPDAATETTLFYDALECDDDCQLALRNHRLAEAFGRDATEPGVTYNSYLAAIVTTCPAFVQRVEHQFQSLISSSQTTYHFPPMPSHQRKIIHELATVCLLTYRYTIVVWY